MTPPDLVLFSLLCTQFRQCLSSPACPPSSSWSYCCCQCPNRSWCVCSWKHTHGQTDEAPTTKLHIDNCLKWGALPEKEHDGAGVVQLVHLVEVWHFCDVHQVNDSEVFYLWNTDSTHVNICGQFYHANVVKEGADRTFSAILYRTSSIFMHVGSQSCPKRITMTRSSSDRMAWSTCQPLWRCGSMYDMMTHYKAKTQKRWY